MKTPVLSASEVHRQWVVVDLFGKTLGRVSTHIADLLIGKGKPSFSYHQDQGDYVIAINTKHVRVTGKKSKEKIYHSYSNYPGGLKSLSFAEMMNKSPAAVLRHAVIGMLPKNKLRQQRMTRLKIFDDASHPYSNKISQSIS